MTAVGGLRVREQERAVQERQDAVVVLLLVVVDERVVVALGALEVAAEEDAAEVARDEVRLEVAVEEELRGRARLRRRRRRPKASRGRTRRRAGSRRTTFAGTSSHAARGTFASRRRSISITSKNQTIRRAKPGPSSSSSMSFAALVGRLVVEERARLGDGRDRAGQIEVDTANEFGVVGARRGSFAKSPNPAATSASMRG